MEGHFFQKQSPEICMYLLCILLKDKIGWRRRANPIFQKNIWGYEFVSSSVQLNYTGEKMLKNSAAIMLTAKINSKHFEVFLFFIAQKI